MNRFQGFSHDSFEQLVRALAIKVIGPGVTAFGGGPDGGREASFKGKIDFPFPPSEIWDGYGVFQAKFKSKSDGSSKDQEWAIAQLRSELEMWVTRRKHHQRPDYFIFCTNVALSSVAGGGKDKVAKLLGMVKYKFKDFAIWDANQLQALIDGQSEIRARFSHFFTPGDLIAAFAKNLNFGQVDADAVLGSYLAREFMTDEDARLSQAGDRSEDRIRLIDVFVDLPSVTDREAILDPEIEDDDDGLMPASLSELLSAGSKKLDPLALVEEQEALASRSGNFIEKTFGRFVFLGGPGSGKSTIGQFLAQVHRAALLERRPKHRLEQNVLSLLKEVRLRCTKDGFGWPATPRYPFRIELNAFAKAISAENPDRVRTLSEYLRKQLSSDISVRHEDLRNWLGGYPWLIIFDGLDEVPASSNRKEVISAIRDFLSEARDVQADLLVVASSRPDGYAQEFDGSEVAHRYLRPLSKKRALLCANKYVEAKIARRDERRANEAMETLKSAVENPLVAKLMHSPLQVTFMVTVVAASGKPSESRWQLFNDYYRTIYERELHKAVPPFDKALNQRRSDIDALHHRVGFILQTRAELSGGTQSDMAVSEFENIVRECLGENGLAPAEMQKQVEMIIGAANQRLVFLTSRTPGRLSFDVRSLQEYMAAACITNEDSTAAIERLQHIFHSAYWRNVLLFAIGRFFVEPHLRPHRNKVRTLCEDLNRSEDRYKKVKLGSRVSLEILQSGVIGDVPLVNRSLSAIALELLDFPPESEDAHCLMLASVYNDVAEPEFVDAIKMRLGQTDVNLTFSSWLLLKFLGDRSLSWALNLINEFWPQDPLVASQILAVWHSESMLPRERVTELGVKYLQLVIPRLSPDRCLFLVKNLQMEQAEESWLSALVGLVSMDDQPPIKIYCGDKFSGMNFFARAINSEKNLFKPLSKIFEEPHVDPTWAPVVEIARFSEDPSWKNLSHAVNQVIKSTAAKEFWYRVAPWPVCQGATMPDSMLNDIDLEFLTPWVTTEARFRADGVELSELLCKNKNFDIITIEGAMAWSFGVADKQLAKSSFSLAVLNGLKTETVERRIDILRFLFCWTATFQKVLQEFSPKDVANCVMRMQDAWHLGDFVVSTSPHERPSHDWLVFFDELGRKDLGASRHVSSEFRRMISWLGEAFNNNPKLLGILKIIGLSASVYNGTASVKSAIIVGDLVEQDGLLDDDMKFAACALLLAQPGISSQSMCEVGTWIAAILKRKQIDANIDLILNVIENNGSRNADFVDVLDMISSSIPSSKWRLHAQIDELRSQILQSCSSGFTSDTLKALHLPQVVM